MNSKHVKSPCCQAKIRRFGQRRRQCGLCKKTWTIRRKKRGRPRHRVSSNLLREVFLRNFALKQLFSGRIKVGLPAFRYRCRQAMARFLAIPYRYPVPKGPLILLADALWFQFGGKRWTLYLTALKACQGNTAYFLRPSLVLGKEGAYTWAAVINEIPAEVRARICAIIADNLRGMQALAERNNWVLQLCQFHMLMKLQLHKGGFHRKLRGGRTREETDKLIRYAMATTDAHKLNVAVGRLNEICEKSCGTKRMKGVVREFVNCISFYRAYLNYPNLGLPTTTNTMEAMSGLIRSLLRRTRAGSNPESLEMWATTLVKMKGRLLCNGRNINRLILP